MIEGYVRLAPVMTGNHGSQTTQVSYYPRITSSDSDTAEFPALQIGRPPLFKLRKCKWVITAAKKNCCVCRIQPAISRSLRGIYIAGGSIIRYDMVVRKPEYLCKLEADVILRESLVTRIV